MNEDLIATISQLRAGRRLHGRVSEELRLAIRTLFPDWVFVPEVSQTPGGRNDAVLFESGGGSVCFELFASRSQVDRDLLLLHGSSADRKIAVLLDREVDPGVADAYYRKRPHKPYPSVWVSDVLDPKQRTFLQVKLMEYVLQERLASVIAISSQLHQTAHIRQLRAWASEGIQIWCPEEREATFVGVMSFLAVAHMRRLGVDLRLCKSAAQIVNDQFDSLVRQVLFGVPVFLMWNGRESSILDMGDYECWLRGAVISRGADHAMLLVNGLYREMRSAYRGELPEPGDMGAFIRLMLESARMLARLDAQPRDIATTE